MIINVIGTQIQFDVGEDITGATTTDLKYKKPSGTCGTWVGALSGTQIITYTTLTDDIDESGEWGMQPYVVMSGWTGHVTEDSFSVSALLCP